MDCDKEHSRESYLEEATTRDCNGVKNNPGVNVSATVVPGFNFKLMDDDAIKQVVFQSVDDARKFYAEYGRYMGFDIRITHTKVQDKIAKNREMECTWAGIPKPPNDHGRRKLKDETRCNCPAQFRVALRGSQYHVTKFISSHNHELATNETLHRLKINRYISAPDKTVLSLFNESGIRTCQSVDYLERVNGGNLSFIRKDAYNFLYRERQESVRDGDVQNALHILDGMKISEPDMFFKYEIGKDNSLTKLFWTDGFSREAYKNFGDVLVFDSTYKTNTYRFPMIILSGVDNHLKNIVFGVALMFNETIESYKWLLRSFLEAMEGKAPKSVLTDQDAAMCAAIEEVFPNAKHRLCSWHLQRNCTQNVKEQGFCGGFGSLLSRNLSVEEFEEIWIELIEDNGVSGHPWITETYAKRERWGEAFFRGHFMGMMRTTQRAESLNALFKQQGKAGYKLVEFIRHYHHVLGKSRSSFLKAQEDSERYKPRLKQGALYSFHKHASSVYTKDVFHLVQVEIFEEQALVVERSVNRDDRHFYYSFVHYVSKKKKVWSVEIDLDSGKFMCDCQMLESDGIPCRHLFCAFKCMRLTEIPSMCILGRWTTQIGINLRCRFPNVYPVEDKQRMRFTRVYQEFVNTCLEASKSEARTIKYIKNLHNLEAECSKDNICTSEDDFGTTNEVDENIDSQKRYNVRDPQRVKSRGAPANKKQKCGICGEAGHKSSTCPARDSLDTRSQKPKKRAKKATPACTQEDEHL